MPGARKGYSLLEMLITIAVSSIMTLASVPLIAGNGDDARAAEARAEMNAIRERARTVYARTGKVPNNLAELSMSGGEVSGTYFNDTSYKFNASAKNWKITCDNVYSSNPRSLSMTVNLVTGEYSFKR
jgi:prepilin-type N-terminal cleavage/methylation domain-containing protein